MKRLIIWGIILIVIAACSGKKSMVNIAPVDEVEITADSVEYELLTFDTKFEAWYNLQNTPTNYRSKSYYENWNKQYVTQWNFHAMSPSRNTFFQTIIGWNPTVDYGFELNHKLFHYFQYVENVLKIPILDGGGPRATSIYMP